MKKQKSHAFGKDVYLLGSDSEGIKHWLEAPSWDCGWYWGFGYIETYEENREPEKARDIDSHRHADKFMSEYFTEWNGSKPILSEMTFDEKEGWRLSELFRRFYILKETAELFGRGGANISGTDESLKREAWTKEINEKIIPEVTKEILSILTPNV